MRIKEMLTQIVPQLKCPSRHAKLTKTQIATMGRLKDLLTCVVSQLDAPSNHTIKIEAPSTDEPKEQFIKDCLGIHHKVKTITGVYFYNMTYLVIFKENNFDISIDFPPDMVATASDNSEIFFYGLR